MFAASLSQAETPPCNQQVDNFFNEYNDATRGKKPSVRTKTKQVVCADYDVDLAYDMEACLTNAMKYIYGTAGKIARNGLLAIQKTRKVCTNNGHGINPDRVGECLRAGGFTKSSTIFSMNKEIQNCINSASQYP